MQLLAKLKKILCMGFRATLIFENLRKLSHLKGTQLCDGADLDTSFLTLKKVYLNLKSKFI